MGVFLSGEPHTLPEAEARALILAYDGSAEVSKPEERVILAYTTCPPEVIARRIAYARRVGLLLEGGRVGEREAGLTRGSTYRVRVVVGSERGFEGEVSRIAARMEAKADLKNPEFEVSVMRGKEDYYLLSRPGEMRQGWSRRRPRSRAYFHPSAIFPKLARALVNLTRVKEGEVLLDPYAGTGSTLIEGAIVGARCVGLDLSREMVGGALENERKLSQAWLGLVRSDSLAIPVAGRGVDAIVTDVPYGRASSTAGSDTAVHVERLLKNALVVLREGGRMVMMHPEHVRVGALEGLELEEEHRLFVHSRLTRTVSVLRRGR